MSIKSGDTVYDKITGYSGIVTHANTTSANIVFTTADEKPYHIIAGPKSIRNDIVITTDRCMYVPVNS